MIKIVEAPDALLLKRNKFKKKLQRNNFLLFSAASILFGAIFSIWDVVIYVIVGYFIIFFAIIEFIYPTPNRENLIIRRDFIKDVRITIGFKTRLKNLDIIFEEDTKNPKLQNSFSVLNDISPEDFGEVISYSNAKTLIGKEIEIEYLEKSGYIVAIRFNPPFVLGIKDKL